MLPFSAHVIHFNTNFAEKRIKVAIINITPMFRGTV